MHVGLLNFDIIEVNRRAHYDVSRLGAFAHDLFVDLGFGWHVDDDIALHLGLTAKAAAVDHSAFGFVTFLDRVPLAERVITYRYAVFGEFAVGRGDLAFRTDAAPAADAVKINTKLPGGGQDGCARRKASALA